VAKSVKKNLPRVLQKIAPRVKKAPILWTQLKPIFDRYPYGTYMDATFGSARHSRAILQETEGRLIGVDADPYSKKLARLMIHKYPERFKWVHSRWSELRQAMDKVPVEWIKPVTQGDRDGFSVILFDLGLNVRQELQPERGFSYQRAGPLDMRHNQTDPTVPLAFNIVNKSSQEMLMEIFCKEGGEEQKTAKVMAEAIVANRYSPRYKEGIPSTTALANILRRQPGINSFADYDLNNTAYPGVRAFLALRNFVNQSRAEFREGLKHADLLLQPGGSLCVLTKNSQEETVLLDWMSTDAEGDKRWELEPRCPIKPAMEDVKSHGHEVRSCNLWVYERTESPPSLLNT